jgi:O-antigen/teichoic acid export membrane protein
MYALGVATSGLKGFHRFDVATWVVAGGTVLGQGAAVAALYVEHGGMVGALVANLLVSLVTMAVAWILLASVAAAQGIRIRDGRASRRALWQMAKFGSVIGLGALAAALMNQVQVWAVAVMLSPIAVTVFSTGFQVVTKIGALVGSTFELILPVTAALVHSPDTRDLRHARSIYMKALGLSGIFSVCASIGLYVLAPALMRAWLRSEIAPDVALIVRILCVGLALNGATPVVYHFMNGIGRPGVNAAFMLGGIVAIYALILLIGARGLTVATFAWATSIAMVVNSIAFIVFAELVAWRRWLGLRSSAAYTVAGSRDGAA